MLRYLGMIWDDASPQQNEAVELLGATLRQLSPAWRQELSAAGMRVFVAGASTASPIHRLADDAGLVIGTAFTRSRDIHSTAPDRQMHFGPQQTTAIVQDRGRWLIEHCWGNYVAFGRDPGGGNTSGGNKWVLKDPTGNLPCFRTDFRGVAIFFSRPADCVATQLLPFSINEGFLNAHLVSGGSMMGRAALNEVSPVRRGECIEFHRVHGAWQSDRRMYWTPLGFSGAEDLIEDPAAAASAMRSVVKAATHSWASLHDSLLLRLSGGLDSSIIAGCLKDAPGNAKFVAYTYFSPNGRSDERPWARLAAEHSQCQHVECPVSPTEMDLRVALQMGPSIEPTPLLSFLQRTTLEQSLAATSQATAIFNGEGGDSGFCSDTISFAVSEYLQRHGLGSGIFRLASQVALLTEKSSWNVLTDALRRRLTRTPGGMPRERILAASQLVSADVRQAFQMNDNQSHPWFQGMRRVPWDKVRRLGTLICTPDYYNVAGDADAVVPEIVAPLYAQPVMELLLRIPIYTHFNGGRDRGLARQAFTEEVPQPILRRLWKDRAPGFHDELLERHREFLKETLLDGMLARERLLDRAMLEQVLSAGPSKSPVYPGEIFRHLDSELWARHWLQPSRQQAAA